MTSTLVQAFGVLQELDIELAAVTDQKIEFRGQRLGAVQEGEHVVSTLDNHQDLKRLYCVSEILTMRAGVAKGEAHLSVDTKQQETDKLNMAFRDGYMSELAREIFWAQVRREFDLYHEAGSVGIRKGWQVVTRPTSSVNPLLKIFGLEG
jgi:hypothetical protein